jgi:hypothetical protein
MKKLILLSFTLSFMFANTQTFIYHPFPDSNANWNFTFNQYQCPLGGAFEYYSYYISGDTSINNEMYHKLSTPFVSVWNMETCLQQHFTGYKGAFRQDIPNKKVYFVPPLSSTEYLLYDFNMEPGDTVPGYLTYNSGDTVVSMDSILVGDNYRKRWFTNYENDIYYIEGIGSTYGLLEFSPGFILDAPSYTLDCMMQNEQTIYPDPDTPCQLITSVDNSEDLKDLFKVYPNPVRDLLYIDHASGSHVQLFSITGLLISESELTSGHSELSLKGIPEGIYYLRFNKDSEILVKKIMVSN